MSNRVKVIEVMSETTLFECPIEDIEIAYQKAREYEEMGIDVEIKAPGIAETLVRSLGANTEEIAEYQKSMNDEIEAHEDLGCAICLDDHSPMIKQ
ncbi:MAG: hypothetical protein L6Q33_00725 [Bacteriovoracaceae bacterium]|jgi:hypothetical protein|nr:hypothetical protein [Bacteriovoracaceae bacterium]